MCVVWLAWFVCVACLLLAVAATAVTYHPSARHLAEVLPAALGAVSLLSGVAAIGLGRLPATHRIRRYGPLWAGLVVLAVIGTLMVLSG